MKDYNEMTAFEVNKAVALLEGYRILDMPADEENPCVAVTKVYGYTSVDYCNNDADIMPIAWANGISVSDEGGGTWAAYHTYKSYSVHEHTNPRRAIAICYLMMQGGEV